mgnify:CR=1 FL=1
MSNITDRDDKLIAFETELRALRENGEEKLSAIKEEVAAIKRNKALSKEEKESMISALRAEEAKARYDEIRQNYQVFYDKVVAMKTHIYNVTAANEEADTTASQTIANI